MWSKYAEVGTLWVLTPFVGGGVAYVTARTLRHEAIPERYTVPVLGAVVGLIVANIPFTLLGSGSDGASIAATVATELPTSTTIGMALVSVAVAGLVAGALVRDLGSGTDSAERHFLLADHPVISVNGNVAALCPDAVVDLAEATGADIEVNLFNRTDERMAAIAEHLHEHGASEVKGLAADAEIPGLDHARATVDADSIHAADVVLVPPEDGDRAAALDAMGKTEIVIDLNPLSRSPQVADVPIVDDLVRALPTIAEHARDMRAAPREELECVIDAFDREAALDAAERTIRSSEPP